MSAPAIGIDLGTTYSCAAVYRNGKVEIIPNAEGDRLTPSMVAFGSERLVGEAAKDQFMLEPRNTIYDVKRLIGRKFDDPTVQRDLKLWPFEVINEQNRPKISVNYQNKQQSFYPEEISAMVLERMKDAASKYLGCEVKEAVITVPAYFSNLQRQATKDAGVIAGLKVLRIINEPTAGAMAYGVDSDSADDERNVLIFDFGGGTFDVTVLVIDCGTFEVKSTAGNTHLGGTDLDARLVDHFVQQFERLHKRCVRDSSKAMHRLRAKCEHLKRKLSSVNEYSVDIDALYAGIDFKLSLTRARFEHLCADLFEATLDTVRQALRDASMDKSEIDDIVLVGGSTRIPAVRQMLRDFFDGKELKETVNPDEAVAAGAAIQAAKLSGDPSRTVMDLLLLDVTPLSLGIDVEGDITYVIIPRNTIIPVKRSKIFETTKDNQTEVDITVMEGERTMTKDNNLIGKFVLSGIVPRPEGQSKHEVTFEIDADGILTVTAVTTDNKSTNSITITENTGRLSKDQINKLIAEAENLKLEDEKRKEAALTRNEFQHYCNNTRKRLNAKENVDPTERRKILEKITETMDWIDSAGDESKEDIERKKREVELTIDLMFLKL